MIDLVNFGGQKDRLHAENGGLWNGTQQDLNKMVDKVKLEGGGGAKRLSICQKYGKGGTTVHTYWLKEGSAPPPATPTPHPRAK